MRSIWLSGTAVAALSLASINGAAWAQQAESQDARATVEDARAFLSDAEAELAEMSEYAGRVFWVQNTNITYDTNWLASRVGSESTQLAVRLATEAARFDGAELPDDLQRKIDILRAGITIPSPNDSEVADELAEITTRLDSTYATGTYEIDGETLDLGELSNIIETSRDPEALREAWEGWRTISTPMAADYARMVEIANQGARDLGFENLAEMWLSNYDMPADEMEAEVARLWGQVEPLYEELHCYVRAELNEEYGDEVQPANGPIRADLLGNMWSQSWANIYPIVAPEGDADPGYDLTQILQEREYDAQRMVETGENFFSSLGFEELPETFWERSMIVQPDDRDVVCHASAWNVDNVDDIRIKMCTEINAEDFRTVHHELGHNYYQRAYNGQDFLFRNGAHDGFHEAIGDFIALSITPEYLQQLELIEQVPSADADLGLLLDTALDKIAFLPFALTVDQWRWSVLRGDITPDGYNQGWWDLRTANQGIVPPGPRPDDAFDPGAKYHIPGNTPYLRYFLSYILQFQFHEAACEMIGWEGPLHRCSVYGNEEVGERFNAMMEMGQSQPWPEALEAFAGTREMDGSAIISYFEPLMSYLDEQNQGRECGW
ncbi:peptidase M2 [Marinicauda pacifica]|uniref:Peptidase M2 family protein n=1 Tax=Marinicauda pacifica TaxID=1133559 RepID=A0A4S2HEN0_9PROT|nr:M2 family metallopeptidase [Marinicauda pacifica]TGY94514.1 peptidase M2 family protein [Marinicauda pacifica]GGE36483.1 peptidase M2 [Marinicauda pacifica]